MNGRLEYQTSQHPEPLEAPEALGDRSTAAVRRRTRCYSLVLVVVLMLARPLGALPARAAGRTYHPEALAWVAAEPPGSAEVPTYLRIEGEVAYVHKEADGDVHIHLCHNGRCMVAECVPGVPVTDVAPDYAHGSYTFHEVGQEVCLRLARLGRHLAVWGISRYDGAPGHGEQAEVAAGRRGHWEIHPVEGIEVLP